MASVGCLALALVGENAYVFDSEVLENSLHPVLPDALDDDLAHLIQGYEEDDAVQAAEGAQIVITTWTYISGVVFLEL